MNKFPKLKRSFYLNEDVVRLSRDLLGKVLCTKIQGKYTSGIITETEAYAGVIDRASHAYNNRRTKRTEIMYHKGGVAYVYLCYGIHNLFNVVTNVEGIPHAILIRGIEPFDGIKHILMRRKVKHQSPLRETMTGLIHQSPLRKTLTGLIHQSPLRETLIGLHRPYAGIATGPGNVTKALGITLDHAGANLNENTIWIEDRKINIRKKDIIAGKRVGIGYAGKDAELLYRFRIKI